MSLERIIQLQVDAGNTARTLAKTKKELQAIDDLLAKIRGEDGGSKNKPLIPQSPSNNNNNNSPIPKATKNLLNYKGQLENTQRIVAQSIGTQTRADTALLKYDTTTRKLNKALAEGVLTQKQYNQAVAQSKTAYEQAAIVARDYDNEMINQQKTAGKTSGAFKAMRGSMANVGFQLQDIAVQAQMGTSAFVILGQQGSQLAGAFGVGGALLGAVIAIGAAIGGVLYESLKTSTDGMKDLEKQAESLDRALSNIDGVINLSTDLQELIRQSPALADLKLDALIASINKQGRVLKDALINAIEEGTGLGGTNILGQSLNIEDITEKVKELESLGLDVADALNNFDTDLGINFFLGGQGRDLATLNNSLSVLRGEYGLTNEGAIEFSKGLSAIADGSISSVDDLNAFIAKTRELINVIAGSESTSPDQKKSLERLREGLIAPLELAIETYSVTQGEATRNVVAFANAIDETALRTANLNSNLNENSALLIDIQDEYDRLNKTQLAANDTEFSNDARIQAEQNAIKLIADRYAELETIEEKQQLINDLNAAGLTIDESRLGLVRDQVNQANAQDDLYSFGDTDEADRLSKSLEILQEKAKKFESDAFLASAIANIKEELIELNQDGNYLDVVGDQLGEAVKFAGVEGAIDFLDTLRAESAITQDQYDKMAQSIIDDDNQIARSANNVLFDLDELIAKYREGADAVSEFNEMQQARSALGFNNLEFITPEQDAALKDYIEKMRALNKLIKRASDESEVFKSIAINLGAGLATGDFSNFASGFSDLFSDRIGSGITDGLTESLGAGTAGILGSFGAGLAGSVASGILAGKEEISRSVRIVFEDGIAQAFTDIEYGSFLGSSTSSIKFNSADNELANNSINNVLKNLSKTFKEIDVTIDDFSGSFTGDTFAGAIENMAEQFINGGFDSIDAFRDLGQSTEDAFDEFVAKIKGLSESVRNVVGTDLDKSIEQFIDQRAQAIDTNAEKAVDFWQSYLRVIDDITNGATEPLETGEQYISAFATASEQLTNDYGGSITRLRKDIAFIEQNQLKEALGRLGEGDLVAYGQFAENLADLVRGGDVTAAFDALNSVIATDTQTYAEIITNAREDLESLGFDGGITAENFAQQYNDTLANGIDENILANYLNAGVLLKNIGDATESLNDEVKETADNLLSLESRLQTALGNDDAATLIDRQIELANATTPAAAALLEQIHAAEDLSEITDENTSLTKRLNEALGNDEINTAIDRSEEYANAKSDEARSTLTAIYAAEDAEIAFNNAASALSYLANVQMGNTDSALAVLEKSIEKQKDILSDAYDAQVDALKEATKDFSNVIGALESLSNSLESAIKSSQADSFNLDYARLLQARTRISTAVSSGLVPTDGSLDAAISTVGGDNKRFYADFASYTKDQIKQQKELESLKELTVKQLGETKSAEDLAEDQLEILQKAYEADIDALDSQLETAREQVDILRNIDVTAISIEDALNKLAIAIGQEGSGTSGFSAQEIKGTAEAIYANVTSAGGSQFDAYRAIGTRAINEGVSSAELAMALGVSQDEVLELAGMAGLPAFASGGTFAGGARIVGENGPELEVTGPSRIYNATQTESMLSGMGSNSEVIKALSYTNQLLRDLNVKMITSNDNTDDIRRQNVTGVNVNVIATV